MDKSQDTLTKDNLKEENLSENATRKQNIKEFKEGIRDGVPIGLAYLAVSFTLGIAAREAGLTVFQGFLAALLTLASAGGYAGFTLIDSGGTYLEMALITVVVNIRYFLMSSALSQKLKPDLSLGHRFLIGTAVTDELFGISFSRRGFLNPYYFYGGMFLTIPCWAGGTALGVVAGNILSSRVVSALSVALYGMFLGIIVPAAKKDKTIAILIAISFILSFIVSKLAVFKNVSDGARIIVLTVLISGFAAKIFPINEEVD